jgi:hypothetical protein
MMSSKDAAEWMVRELSKSGYLSQDVAVYGLQKAFNGEATYMNGNGNLAIAKPVLTAFRALTDDSIVWSRGDRAWRKRQNYDKSGRQQD